MTFFFRRFRSAAVVCAALLCALPLTIGSAFAAQRGSVYLMRGLANVFSTGMNTLNDELRAKGVDSHVMGDADWYSIAQAIEARYAKDKGALPVIVMGHSLGANATLLVAQELNKHKIPVALIVNFDANTPPPVPANVRRVINFYAPDGIGKRLVAGAGFRGSLENVNVLKLIPDINHLTIEKNRKLHSMAIAAALRALGR